MKTKVYMIQAVELEYSNDKELQKVIKSLKQNPNCLSLGGGNGGFRKIPTKIRISKYLPK